MRWVLRQTEFERLLWYVQSPEAFSAEEPSLDESLKNAARVIKQHEPWAGADLNDLIQFGLVLYKNDLASYGELLRNSPVRWGSHEVVRATLRDRVMASPLLRQWYQHHLTYCAGEQQQLLERLCAQGIVSAGSNNVSEYTIDQSCLRLLSS